MDTAFYHNPYTGLSFVGFFEQLFLRLLQFLKGDLPIQQLASDEIQVLVLLAVAASCALVGTFLVLRRMTMLANSLSHTILIGIVIAFLWTSHSGERVEMTAEMTALLGASFMMGLLTTFLTELLTKVVGLQEDASTGLVFTGFFALGIMILTAFMRNAHIGTEAVMGNVDALQLSDCRLVYLLLALNLLLFILFFKEYQLTTFDSGLARALGISPLFFNYLLMAQVSMSAVGAFRAVGVLMVLAFMTGPPLTARLLTHDLKKMLGLAVALGCLASVMGVALSRHFLSMHGQALSTAGLVVCMILCIYLAAVVYTKVGKRKRDGNLA